MMINMTRQSVLGLNFLVWAPGGAPIADVLAG